MEPVTLVGGTFSPEGFATYLDEQDPCFGKHFAKSAPECKRCTAPVIVEGALCFLRDLCEARTKGASSPAGLVALTSRDVMERLERGSSAEEIFREVLGDSDPQVAAVAARQLLYSRFYYIRTELEVPVPELPPTEELIDSV